MKKKKFLVTGSAGFIGNNIVERLLNLDQNVIAIDNLSFGKKKCKTNFLNLDISNESDVKNLFDEGFDVVFHLAAVSGAQLSHDEPKKDIETNILGTLNILRYSEKQKVKKVVNTSSVSVYGNSKLFPIKETHACNPTSQYGISKLTTEMYANLFKNMDITNLRLFNVYGPGQDLNNFKQGMISIYLYYITRNQSIITKGSKHRFRDFVYIEDVVDAYFDCLKIKKGTYNICTGKKTTVEELQNKLLKLMNKENHQINYLEETTPGDPFGTVGSYEKFNKASGWSPKINLEKGLQLTVDWIKNESNNSCKEIFN